MILIRLCSFLTFLLLILNCQFSLIINRVCIENSQWKKSRLPHLIDLPLMHPLFPIFFFCIWHLQNISSRFLEYLISINSSIDSCYSMVCCHVLKFGIVGIKPTTKLFWMVITPVENTCVLVLLYDILLIL